MSRFTTPVIDADAHISEPPGLFRDRVPSRMRDRVPYIGRGEDGHDVWILNGEPFHHVGISAHGAGWKEPLPSTPATFEDMNPAAYDAKARLEYMDSVGIWAQVLYPNVAGFGAQRFLQMEDPEVMLACVRAYNDFQTEWVCEDPNRLLAVTALPFWDIDATVAEVVRCAEMGHRALLFSGEPNRFGFPVLGSPHWDPLWSVASETELSISFHIGGADAKAGVSVERIADHGFPSAFGYGTVSMLLGNGMQIGDLLLSGVLPRFQRAKFVSVESGVGFIPFVLEVVDYAFKEGGGLNDRGPFEELPSHYFKDQVFGCAFFEDLGRPGLVDQVGVGNILFETDLPHPLCLYGQGTVDKLNSYLNALDELTRLHVTWSNAAALYKVDTPADFRAVPDRFVPAAASS